MTELKTLKEINVVCPECFNNFGLYFSFENKPTELKAEAIKWIKEDIKIFESDGGSDWLQIERWMKRLNITEEDLK